MNIYLDESGDLGWTLNKPYQRGGSSRYLTIGSLVVSDDKKYLPKRLIRNLYKQFKWPVEIEKKWSTMTNKERERFADQARKLITANSSDIKYYAITVKKEKVQRHIRNDPNKLYNYMILLSLLDEMGSSPL